MTIRILWSHTPGASRTIELQQADAAWVEGTITWNLQPGVTGGIVTALTGTTDPVRNTWAVTVDVAAFVAGTQTNNGWRLKDETEDSAGAYTTKYRSKEHGTASERPQLFVFYATP